MAHYKRLPWILHSCWASLANRIIWYDEHSLTCDSHSVVFGDFTRLMESVNATLEAHLNFPEQLISCIHPRVHSFQTFFSRFLHTKQLVQLYHMNSKNHKKKRPFFWLYESEAIFSFGHLLKGEVTSSFSARLIWKYQACSFYNWNRFLCAWLARLFHSGEGAKSGTRNILYSEKATQH